MYLIEHKKLFSPISIVMNIYTQWRSQGVANKQLPISFGGLPIVVFICKFLPIEILLCETCLFIFELGISCNGWAIKNVTFCILTISHSLFILTNSIFFQNIPRLTLYRTAYTLVRMIV